MVAFTFVIWKTLTPNAEPIDGIRHIRRAWNTSVAQSAYTHLQTRCDTPADTARLKAVAVPHAGDWLNAPPITTMGLRLSNEAIRVAVGFRLGCITCQPHICICGAMVDDCGLQGLSCRKSGPRHTIHSQLNTHCSCVNTHCSCVNTHCSYLSTHCSYFNTHCSCVNTRCSCVNT